MDAGAKTFLSQPIYSSEAISNIARMKETLDARIYAGILPPVSLRNARFLKNEVPGIRIPDSLIDEFEKTKEKNQQTVGVKYSVKIAAEALQYADGIYLMLPFGKVEVAAEFFDLYNKLI
jgi:homocysteine S-methyltransferase